MHSYVCLQANLAKDSAPKLYSRDDSPAGSPTRLYNPEAAREVAPAADSSKMAGFGSSKTGSPLTSKSRPGLSGKKMQGFGSSSVGSATAAPKPPNNSGGWDDDLFNEDLGLESEEDPQADNANAKAAANVAEMDDDALLGDIDSVLADSPHQSTAGAQQDSSAAKVEQMEVQDEDDDFFKEFGM